MPVKNSDRRVRNPRKLGCEKNVSPKYITNDISRNSSTSAIGKYYDDVIIGSAVELRPIDFWTRIVLIVAMLGAVAVWAIINALLFEFGA